jgi:hypothetical protein
LSTSFFNHHRSLFLSAIIMKILQFLVPLSSASPVVSRSGFCAITWFEEETWLVI